MSRWDQLLALQEHDTQIDQLTHRLATLPARAELAKLEGENAEVGKRLEVVDERMGALNRSQQRLEDEIALLNDKAVKADQQLYSGSTNSPKELQAIQDEIASITRHIARLEDEQLDVMEATEPVEGQRGALVAEYEHLQAEAGRVRSELADAVAVIEAELASVREQRAEIAATVPEALVTDYERLRTQLGGVAIAPLVGSTCQGCHLQLSAVELDRIRRLPADETVHCEECGRLLVRS